MARHFWDALDFRSDPLAVDTAFMEQNFANFISVLAVTLIRPARPYRAWVRWFPGIDAFSLLESVAENIPRRPQLSYANEAFVHVVFQ